ncbi:MAG: hypothetical protein RBT11_18680 [Desulfobacterales bacterium]|jgi:hypothetical protein|nr:hypothetical protein [Desulfobacterales bacterium]
MWIEIFKGGRQTDGFGREHDGDQLIDAAVDLFDEKNLPPLVLGHPRDNKPAYGWVNRVKSVIKGGVKLLLADVAPVEALRGWVNGKLYTNRSAAFHPDGRLLHVGFLGGRAPAVKGLAPLPEFGEGGEAIVSFDKVEDIDHSPHAVNSANLEHRMFTAADIAEAKFQARIKVLGEFAKAEAVRKKTAREEGVKSFCEAGVKAGKLAPSWVSGGLAMFMEQLPADVPIQFCDGTDKKTPAVWFREFIEWIPKLVDISKIG